MLVSRPHFFGPIFFAWVLACTEDVSPQHPLAIPSTGGAAAVDGSPASGGSGLGGGLANGVGGGPVTGAGGADPSGENPPWRGLGGQPSDEEAPSSGSGGAAPVDSGGGGLAAGGSASPAAGGSPAVGNGAGGRLSGAGGLDIGSGGAHLGGAGAGGSSQGGTVGSGEGGSGIGGQPVTLPYGFAPATVSWDDAVRAYEDWKAVHLEDCGGGVYRVPWENARLDATVSEGIGYGMLLTVAHDDRTAFDGLFAYYDMALDEYGLMHWLRYGCDAHWEQKYNEYPDNAASDADLDVAMALLMASCKWGGDYGAEATRIIDAMEASMIGWDGSVAVLQPGDSSFFDNNGCINYSYFAPGYYRAFAQHVPQSAEFWNKLADDSYVLLARASHPSTGLVRNWGSTSGGSVEGCTFDFSDDYGDDAARTPWRIATDYLWWGNREAKAWVDKVTAWVVSQPLPELGQWYHLDGSLDTSHDGYADHTAINIGPWSVGAMAHSQAAADALAAELKGIPTSPGSHDAEYFPRCLRALSLLALSGNWTTCGGER